MVSDGRKIVRDLLPLKIKLDKLGLNISAKLLPSVLKNYANNLSRRFSRG